MRISRIRRKRRYHQHQYDLIEMGTNAMKNSATLNRDIPNVNARIRSVLDRVQSEIDNLRSEFGVLPSLLIQLFNSIDFLFFALQVFKKMGCS